MSITASGPVRRLFVLILALTLAGCESGTEPPQEITFDAIVQVMILEGPNTFVLRVDDSFDSYYPLNLPAEFQVEGMRVRVEGLLIRHYQVLLHQPVEILAITRL